MENLYQERIKLFKDTTRMVKTKRVPILSNFWSYKISDAGYTLSEGLFDFEILTETVCNFHEKYNFDCYYETNWRNPVSIARALGRVNYIINDETNSISFIDESAMKFEDYEELIENPEKYLWEKFIDQKYPGANIKNVISALGEFGKYLQFRTVTTERLKNEYQVPGLSVDDIFAPIENLGSGMRGLKNLSIDIRRNPEKVADALESLEGYYNNLNVLEATATVGTSSEHAFDIHVPLISHTLMGKKAFERFYWPFLKKLFEFADKFDKTISLFVEGDNTRLYEYFQEIPEGRVAMYLEQDDIFEAKKQLGNHVCLVGGFSTALLATSTPEKCVDYAKKLIDELGRDGGYIFAADKMISFKRDCRPENLLAVNDFVRNYSS